MAHPDITASVLERFWPYVDKSGDCWVWTRTLNKAGYGTIQIARRPWLVHRISWAIANGRPVPDGLMVLHGCDNRACVRPDHLRTGTAKDNAADAVARGRKRKTYNYLMSVSYAAMAMDVPEAEVRAMIGSGELEAQKSGDWLVYRFTVRDWLAQRESRGKPGRHAARSK